MDFDATDRAILGILQDDARITNNDLADRVHLSPSACLRRVRRLEQNGSIDRYVTLLDPVAVGRATTVFVEISLESQDERHLDAFEAEVVTNPEIMSCHLMAGNADYLLQVRCADVDDYERIHRTRLALLPGVTRIRSSFALRTVCQRTALPF